MTRRATKRWGRVGRVASTTLTILLAATLVPSAGAGPIPGPSQLEAQSTAPADPWRLTLAEALTLARGNNPAYLQSREEISAAEWQVREAYASLLPTASSSLGMRYTGAGDQLIGTFTTGDFGAASTDTYLSSYSLNFNYSLSGSDLFALSSTRADRSAAEARFAAAGFDLEARVTARYVAALRARDAAAVAERQLDRARENFELASVRFEAGGVPGTDLRQAEVEAGRAEVALVRARNSERVAKLALLEEIGVQDSREMELVSDLEVFEPDIDAEILVGRALDAHPRLSAFRQTERARRAGVRQAQSGYLPSVSAYLSFAGYSREYGNEDFILAQARSSVESQRQSCMFWNQVSAGLTSPLDGYPQNCGQYQLTPVDEVELLSANDAFPFNFTDQPVSAGLQISVPIFQGFTRQRQVEQAQVQARTAMEGRRAEELAVRTRVATAHGNLESAYQVLEIEERNRQLAAEQLDLAQQRYEMGAAPIMELLEAQTSVATAEQDYLNAVYDFHAAWANLEQATGLQLTPDGAVESGAGEE